jgi:hypothetical protein
MRDGISGRPRDRFFARCQAWNDKLSYCRGGCRVFEVHQHGNHWTTRVRLLLVTLGICPIFPTLLRAQEANWRIDPLHSGVHFSVRHMMISTVCGEFTGITGSVTYDSKDPTCGTLWQPRLTVPP